MSIQDVELSLERALREALATRRALSSRISEVEDELQTLRRRLTEVDRMIEHTQAALGRQDEAASQRSAVAEDILSMGRSAPASSDQAPSPPPPNYKRPVLRPDIKPQSLRFRDLKATQAATIVLRESGGPMHVNAIYNKLLENGFEFHGEHPTISLAVALSRSKRFRRVSPATFDLVMRDLQGARASASSS